MHKQIPGPDIKYFPGSSFVDVSLKVVIHQAIGTMMAFQPEQLHGTTKSNGAVNPRMRSLSLDKYLMPGIK